MCVRMCVCAHAHVHIHLQVAKRGRLSVSMTAAWLRCGLRWSWPAIHAPHKKARAGGGVGGLGWFEWKCSIQFPCVGMCGCPDDSGMASMRTSIVLACEITKSSRWLQCMLVLRIFGAGGDLLNCLVRRLDFCGVCAVQKHPTPHHHLQMLGQAVRDIH